MEEMTLRQAIEHLDESLGDTSRDWGYEECKREHEQLRAWLVELEQLKESGAVVVVRCKDCKYCEYPAPNVTKHRCTLFDRCVIANWFCAEAERKDNGNA